LNKSFGDIKILEDFSYNFKRGEKVGIVGDNGCGKTTLLNILNGTEQLNGGRIEIGQTVVIGYYTQDGIVFDDNKRVIDVIKDVAEDIGMGDGRSLSPTQFLNYFLFPPTTHYSYVSKLSGGEKRRLYLITDLMRNPNFLILDEPTNDLDIMTLNVLEDYLKEFQGCVLIVSHDRFFMDKIVDHLFVFQGEGQVKDYPGNYSQYREWEEGLEKTKRREIKPKTIKNEEKNSSEKTKLTYKEKIEYDKISDEIEQLETEKSEIEEKLSQGVLSSDEIIAASKRLSEIDNLLPDMENRWLYLSEWGD